MNPLDPRASALHATGLMDARPSPLLEGLTRIVARLLGVPVAIVSLVDERRQWFAGLTGLTGWAAEQRGTPLSHSICQHVVTRRSPLLISDCRLDPLVADNAAVDELAMRAYAGVPLITGSGETLGALCAIDAVPREWSTQDVAILEDLARAAVAELELRIALAARHASEVRLAGVIESATDAIISTDADQRIVLANPAAERLFGYTAAELIGKPLDLLVPEDRRDRHRVHVERFAADGMTMRAMGRPHGHESLVLSARRRDGTTFPIDASISQVATGDGRLFTVILRDVSTRVAAEEEQARVEDALRESEARARVLFRDSPMPMWVFDLETLRIQDVNRAALARYGYTREEFCSLTATQLRPPEEVPRFLASVAAPRHGIAHVGIFRHQTKQGVGFDVEVTAQDTTYNGRRARIVLAGDITERRKAEEALRGSEQRYALAVRATGNAIWDWDLATDAIMWGEGASVVMGYTGEVPTTFAWWNDRVHPEDRERLVDGLRQVTNGPPGHDEWRAMYRFRREDGSYATVVDRGSVLRDETGRVIRMIGALEDVTAQVTLETQLRQAQKMEAIGQLAGGVAHDFNNLLTIIQGNLAFVQAELEEQHPARADIEEVRMAAERAAGLVRQLLTFSRQQPVRPEDVHLTVVVQQAEKLLRRVIGEEIRLAVTLADVPTLVRVDPGQLEQVLMNLAVNARDAMLTPQHGHAGRGGTLSIDVDVVTLAPSESRAWDHVTPGRWVRLVVRDTGHGMDAETQAHIFEPFFTTKAVGAGTGLGLSTVFGIVRQAGGAIRVDSGQGRGTTFTILLPALAGAAVTHDTATVTPVTTPAVRATVLLVEDEEGVRNTARRILERRGYAVLEARHGAEALVIWNVHREEIDVVVTDLRMPVLGGRELMAHLAADRPHMPVVLVSGYADVPDVPTQRPNQVLLAKPFTIDALLTAIADAMRSSSEAIR